MKQIIIPTILLAIIAGLVIYDYWRSGRKSKFNDGRVISGVRPDAVLLIAALPVINTSIVADKVEQAFYRISQAGPSELRTIEASIPELTKDAYEQSELMQAILIRFGALNAEATPKQTPRWH